MIVQPAISRNACFACNAIESEPFFEQTDRLYRTTAERFTVVRCSACGMARLALPPDPATLARYYPENYWFDPAQSGVSRLAARYRTLVLRDHLGFIVRAYRNSGGAGRLLDAGCGGGLLPGMLRQRGIPAFGLDASPTACALAWSRHHVPATTGDLRVHPFQPESFAVVTLFHVVEHLYDPAAYLAAAYCLLAPNGRLVVQVPNADSWQARLFGKRWNGFDVPRHLQHFRARDIVAVVERARFQVVRRKQFSWRDNPAGFATSAAPTLEPVARRVRGLPSTAFHLAAYSALVAIGLPFALAEAAFGHGSSIMLEARKR